MKPAISKQAVLKGLLLTVLAANISWEPFKALSSYDAALESVTASGETSRTREGGGETARLTAPPAERTQRETVTTTKHEETRIVCGVSLLFRFEKVANENKVREEVIRRFPDNQVLAAHTEVGEFSTVVTNVESRAEAIKYLEELARPKLASCATTISSGSNTSAGTNSTAQTDTQRKRLEADIKNCKRDSDGKLLDSGTRLDCNRERLTDIEPIDEDDRKSKRDSQTAFNSIVAQIRVDLKKEVKESLMNDDQGGARELVEEAINEITEAGKEIEISPSTVQRAAREIMMDFQNTAKAVTSGKELDAFADNRKGGVDEMKSMAEMYLQQANDARAMGDNSSAQLYGSQAALLLSQGKGMATEYNRFIDSRIAQLRGYQNQGHIDFSDYTDFTSSTNDLRNQLMFFQTDGRMTGSNGLPVAGSITVGPDFLQYRTQIANSSRGAYTGVPVRPTLNFTPGSSVMSSPLNPTFTSGNPRLGQRF